jgi:hypothetical protein
MKDPDDKEKSLRAVTAWEHESRVSNSFELNLPKIRLSVEIKTSPEQEKWQPCVEAEVALRQPLKMNLLKQSFDQRTLDIEPSGAAQVTATARFVDGFEPRNPALEVDAIAKTFAKGWQCGGQMQLMREREAKDLHFGSTTFRVSDVRWLDPFSVKFFDTAHTRITNSTPDTVDYYTRVAASDWGGPYHLKPGQSHEFKVPYGLIVYYRTRDGVFTRTVPLGTQCEVTLSPNGTAAPAMQAEMQGGLERQ